MPVYDRPNGTQHTPISRAFWQGCQMLTGPERLPAIDMVPMPFHARVNSMLLPF